MTFRPELPTRSILYISLATEGLGATEIRQIVGAASVANRRRDVTGLLAFTGRHFVQVLEGESAELDRLLAALRADLRHRDLRVVFSEPINARRYGRWSMHLVESPDLADEIEALLSQPTVSAEAARTMAARLFDAVTADPY